ncbi:hypothetical protein [Pusillimonas minor]|uniref:Wzy n=1 Tax=Pusillimonas minor TaxID=2697024 RepID=A0A842HPQ8_9BURK|nr:hypothetical protein [Pusillimonas minor]MBC2769844.1 hypothetical protein [Pusillimonas minor]
MSMNDNFCSIRIVFSLLLISLLPPFLMVMGNQSSLAVGLLLCSLLVFLINFRNVYFKSLKINLIYKIFSFAFIIFFYCVIPYFYYGDSKALTLIPFLPVLAAAYLFSRTLVFASEIDLNKSIFFCFFILIFIGWLGFFTGGGVGPYSGYIKAVPPFAEQSHYALSVGFFALSSLLLSGLFFSLFIIFNLFVLAFLFPSLTLLLFAMISFLLYFLRFGKKRFVFFVVLFCLLFFSLISWISANIHYFGDRLKFDAATNLTTLVWFQGWDLAYSNLIRSYGLGVGAQRLGLSEDQLVGTTYEIYRLYGAQYNLEDGGFLASKIISEFGVLGIVFVLYCSCKICGYFLKLVSFGGRDAKTFVNDKAKIFYGLLIAFLVEMFFRGYGYYSPGVFLALSVSMALSERSKKLAVRNSACQE